MRTHMERIVEVAATPEQVWELVADPRRLIAAMQPRTTVTTEGGEGGPVRMGTKVHLVEKNGLKSDWTVVTLIKPKEVRYRIDLGVWDGGTLICQLTRTEGGTSVRYLTPTVPWPQTWAPVRWGTWPLVLMEAKRTCDRFEQALRAHVAELGTPAPG
jgi:carbon monoxide dehydrogenase subunit G